MVSVLQFLSLSVPSHDKFLETYKEYHYDMK